MSHITGQYKILIPEFQDIYHIRINYHHGKFIWFPCKLKLNLLNMIQINMSISECMNKIPGTRPVTWAIICVRRA